MSAGEVEHREVVLCRLLPSQAAGGDQWPLVLLPGVLVTVDRGVIQSEERYLQTRFGREYDRYRRRVRRWA